MKKVILASASPRRRELLDQVNIEYQLCPSTIEEQITSSLPREVVESLASQKALDVAGRMLETDDKRIVLGADTVVAFEDQILGKPVDDADAVRMLQMLSGHTHQVYTGVCLVKNVGGRLENQCFSVCTNVRMYPLTKEQIKWYVSTKEPADKAGAYGIQGLGAVLVEAIEGDYNNVVGLPLSKVWHTLEDM